VGTYLDVSVADGVLWLMSLPVDEHLALDTAPEPGHDILSGRFACYATYQAGDGKWLSVGAIEAKFFANLCAALACDDLVALQLDVDAQPTIRAALASAFATRDRDDWVALLADADTCVTPVLSVAETVDDAQFAARDAVTEAIHPTAGSLRQLAPLLAGMDRPTQPIALPDPAATQTIELLRAAGVEASRIDTWVERRVVA
jgi:crotonobetainyl-CoA:carnitine CoA-transferase CaiB-like acyl-CoA transferase